MSAPAVGEVIVVQLEVFAEAEVAAMREEAYVVAAMMVLEVAGEEKRVASSAVAAVDLEDEPAERAGGTHSRPRCGHRCAVQRSRAGRHRSRPVR